MMTKRDFEAIATVVQAHHIGASPDQVKMLDDVALALALTFKVSNPNFNKARFLSACSVERVNR